MIDEARRTSFDSVAERYERVRPGYPEALFEDLFELGQVPAGGRVLEIGAGTGRATEALLRRDVQQVVALEPGAELGGVVTRKFAGEPPGRLLLHQSTFESWPLEPEAFDLAVAAQSFHWVDPAVGFSKAARALRSRGALGLLWNCTLFESWEPRQRDALDAVYAEHHGPNEGSYAERDQALDTRLNERQRRIEVSGCFAHVQQRRYRWERTYSLEDYLALLDTYSDNLTLAPDRHQRFFEDVRRCLEETGGEVRHPYLTVLYVARRA